MALIVKSVLVGPAEPEGDSQGRRPTTGLAAATPQTPDFAEPIQRHNPYRRSNEATNVEQAPKAVVTVRQISNPAVPAEADGSETTGDDLAEPQMTPRMWMIVGIGWVTLLTLILCLFPL